ncbi:hypothetical protein [Alicyclobacillus sp. ALC3]|uniref:hypothetical protein n=1 Tax=Alicyclobacillus sp. ALC3 TaxID=2796143 RepID=UPI002379CC31|nr:hypothetical protein [Alicyclobacillus sp. ALC3]WDL96375.1 hypothetical protein JC200_18925 [Alicyclobacillus sp. ALC3]
MNIDTQTQQIYDRAQRTRELIEFAREKGWDDETFLDVLQSVAHPLDWELNQRREI